MSEFLCAWLPVFRLQAAAGRMPQRAALAFVQEGPLEVVAAANRAAGEAGIAPGMALAQALGRCPAVLRWEGSAPGERQLALRLLDAATATSPRVQAIGADLVVLDFAGLQGLYGSTEAAAGKLVEDFAASGLELRTGIAAEAATALLAAKSGMARLPAGGEAAALAPLPVERLAEVQELTSGLATREEVAELLGLLERWGIRTLGALAGLPPAALAARLGKAGTHLQALAAGKVSGLLQPAPLTGLTLTRLRGFASAIGDLESLKAVVGLELAALAPELEARDHLVERIELRLGLETNAAQTRVAVYERGLATPTREVKTLAAQLGLELEREPPAGGVLSLELAAHLARPRRIQTRLFAAAQPDKAKLPQLLARLAEIFNDHGAERVGSPRLLDTFRPRAFAMEGFAPPPEAEGAGEGAVRGTGGEARLGLRALRPPVRLQPGQGRIARRAGPWRSRGGWWRGKNDGAQWACDEWDAEIHLQGHTGLYRLQHDAAAEQWFIVGRYD